MARVTDVSARVPVGGRVAAPDVAAAPADAEVDPGSAGLQAVLTAGHVLAVGDLHRDLVEVSAGGHPGLRLQTALSRPRARARRLAQALSRAGAEAASTVRSRPARFAS